MIRVVCEFYQSIHTKRIVTHNKNRMIFDFFAWHWRFYLIATNDKSE